MAADRPATNPTGPPTRLQAVPSLPWPPLSRQPSGAAPLSGDRRARARARNLPGDRPPLLQARATSACNVSISASSRVVPASRRTWWSAACALSQRDQRSPTLSHHATSERGNRSRLASERAASDEILRRAPRTAYVSISTGIDWFPWATRHMLPNMSPSL